MLGHASEGMSPVGLELGRPTMAHWPGILADDSDHGSSSWCYEVEENVMAVLTDGERRRQGDGYEPATERSCGECWSRLRLSSFYRARTTRRRGIAGGREMVVGGFNVPF
jgi:hypothetical protein